MTDAEIRMVKALQKGLPLTEEPFAEVAAEAGVSQEELLDRIRDWRESGVIRRVGAVLRHHKAGYSVNAMGVWDVPEEQVDEFAETAVSIRAVSHCYQRPRFGGFRYNLYTMIHGKSQEDCEATAREISERTGITNFRLLYTTAEFKKSSPVYFA